MATVTGLTAARMLAIESQCIISGAVVGDILNLTRKSGAVIAAGNVRGPQGTQGVQGVQGVPGLVAPRFFTSMYYTPEGSRADVLSELNTMTLVPFFVASARAFTRIAAYVSTAGATGSKLRLGIYIDGGQGFPTNLVLDAGLIAADTIGAKEITVAYTLQPELYWLACVPQLGTPVLRTVVDALVGGAGNTSVTAAMSLTPNNGWIQANVSSSLPATFTSGGNTPNPTLVGLRT